MKGSIDHDLVVIGGGIHGCAVARDAALRGMDVVLFEREDLASGTSSASSKLAHGGLRYLETAQLRLVREGLRERGQLLHAAPHLVRPLPFLVPLYADGRWGKWMLRAGLTLYDLLAGRRGLGRHGWLDAEAVLGREGELRADGLRGAFTFHDAQMDDARLCIETAVDAARHGAEIRTRCEVIGLLEQEGRIRGVRVRDEAGVREVRARAVINCAGPWIARVADGQELARRPRLRWSRGTHIVLDPRTNGHALLLSAPADRRVVFAMPYKGMTLMGTTEVETRAAPNAVEPTSEEIDYLLDCSRAYFPACSADRDDVRLAFAGLRTFPESDETDPGRISREAMIQEDAPGLLSLVGGKYTTHRSTAEEMVDRIARRLPQSFGASTTENRPLPGAEGADMNDYFQVAEDILLERYPDLDVAILRHLHGTYGARNLEILGLIDEHAELSRRVEEGLPFTWAEVVFGVRQEWARSVDDVVRRRTYRAMLGKLTEEQREQWQRAVDAGLDLSRT